MNAKVQIVDFLSFEGKFDPSNSFVIVVAFTNAKDEEESSAQEEVKSFQFQCTKVIDEKSSKCN